MDESTIPGQLDDIAARFHRIELAQVATDRRMTRLEKGLQENTDLTRDNTTILSLNHDLLTDLRDQRTFVKVGGRAIRWLGGIAAGGLGLWQLWDHVKLWMHR